MNQFMLNTQKDSPCCGCHYWRDMFVCYGCHYILVTGKRRGCDPGEGCIRRKPMDAAEVQRENRVMYNQAFYGYVHSNV